MATEYKNKENTDKLVLSDEDNDVEYLKHSMNQEYPNLITCSYKLCPKFQPSASNSRCSVPKWLSDS